MRSSPLWRETAEASAGPLATERKIAMYSTSAKSLSEKQDFQLSS
jgi:hypothetical protein